MTIEKANAARKQLLALNVGLITRCMIVLGDKGFRLEVVFDHRTKWIPPAEFMGFPVVTG